MNDILYVDDKKLDLGVIVKQVQPIVYMYVFAAIKVDGKFNINGFYYPPLLILMASSAW